jgi:hypothetical protein
MNLIFQLACLLACFFFFRNLTPVVADDLTSQNLFSKNTIKITPLLSKIHALQVKQKLVRQALCLTALL